MQHKDVEVEVVTPQLTVTSNVGSVRNVGTREQELARVEEWHAGFSPARYIILSATTRTRHVAAAALRTLLELSNVSLLAFPGYCFMRADCTLSFA